MFNRIVAALFAAFFAVAPATADQSNTWSPTTGTVSGLALTNNYNNAFKAMQTCNSGSSAPANDVSLVPVKGQCWLDTSATPNIVKNYDGSTWVVVGYLDTVNHRWLPPIGGGTATVASATTTDLGASPNSYLTISGTTSITGFGSSAVTGTIKELTFSGALQLTHSSPGLILPNNTLNITTVAGDTATAVATGSGNWTVVRYTRADGTTLNVSASFGGAVSFNSIISPSALSSNTNDWNPSGLSTANTIRFSSSSAITISGITAPAVDGKIVLLDNIGSTNAVTITTQDTNSSASNRFSLSRPYILRPLTQIAIRYDLTSARWKLLFEATAQPIAGGFRNLRVFNVATAMGDSAPATPANMMTVKADALTVEDANGTAHRLTGVSCTMDISGSGSGGLDTGTVSAPNWYAEWVIFNPTTNTTSCLFSLQSSFASITLPSGYTFGARVGWNRYVLDNGVTQLRRIVQYGRKASYAVTAGTNTPAYPLISNGSAGTYSITSPTWVSASISPFVPVTAAVATIVPMSQYNANTNSNVLVAPNASYLGISSVNPPPIALATASAGGNVLSFTAAALQLEGTSIYWVSGGAGGAIFCAGWEDNFS